MYAEYLNLLDFSKLLQHMQNYYILITIIINPHTKENLLMEDGDFLAQITPDGSLKILDRISDKVHDYTSEENVSNYLMNSLNALFLTDITRKDYDFLQYLSGVFDMTQYATPIIYEAIKRTHADTLEDAILFEIARCYTNAIVQNPAKGYNALNAIYASKYPLFKDADSMTDDELYSALEKSQKTNITGYSVYGAICCCLFLTPNQDDERWYSFSSHQSGLFYQHSIQSEKKRIEIYWNIDDLYEDKTFNRFLKKRRYELAAYLKCNEDNIQYYLIKIMPWNEVKNEKQNPTLVQSETFKFMKMIFQHLTKTSLAFLGSFNTQTNIMPI